jgi:nucleotide-binding universal stress UspA family protein
MLRSILVALDDTPGAAAARDLAFALARRHGARVTGLLVLDRPHTLDSHEPVPVGGGAFAIRRNAALAAAVEAEAAQVLEAAQAAAQGLSFAISRRDEAPEPALLAEGAAHDLVVIGRDSTLGREACEDGLSPTIEALIRDGARPLLVVPPGPSPSGPVLAVLEAGLASQRTLQLFLLLGLGAPGPVRLLSLAPAETEAVAGYFAAHGVAVQRVGKAEASGDDAVLSEAAGASLLVMGAGEEGGLHRLVFGSETARLLRAAPCPVFIHG